MRVDYEPPSKRRLTAARKAIEKETEACGLFPWMAPQETPEERCARLDEANRNYIRKIRQRVADSWRDSRAKLYALPDDERRKLIEEWNKSGLPGSNEYFAGFLRKRGL